MPDFSSELLCRIEFDAEMTGVCGYSDFPAGEPHDARGRPQARRERANCGWYLCGKNFRWLKKSSQNIHNIL
jgi:hypothetical protein